MGLRNRVGWKQESLEVLIVIWLPLIGFICLFIFLVYMGNSAEKRRDAEADYSQLLGKISQRENGDIWLGFKYTKNEINKFNYIRKTYEPGHKYRPPYNNDIYVVSHTVNPIFIDKQDKDFKDGIYYVIKLVSKFEYDRWGNQTTNNGPVQYNFDGNNFQDNRFSSYYNQIIQYKNEMVTKGIPEEEIDYLANNTEDKENQRSFLRKYEPILRGIEVASAAATLFEILKGLFFR